MNTLTVLLQQIGMFVIYIITGVILIRTKVLTRENLEIISKVVIKLSLPVMIFINTVNGVDRKSFFSSLSILGIAVVMYVCLLILGTLSWKSISSSWRTSAIISCNDCIRKRGIYGNSYCCQHISGKRNAVYGCFYDY